MSETDPRRDALRCIECEFRTDDSPDGWYELSDHRRQTGHRYEHVKPARKPLTVADIPAGEGPASLFLATTGTRDGGTTATPGLGNGPLWLWFKDEDGTLLMIERAPSPTAGANLVARWNHLAATLPYVTTEED